MEKNKAGVGNPVPAVFLDRDGTINVEKEYLHRIEDFEFIPGAPEAIKRLKDAGYLVFVVTNQSGVARGFYSLDDVDALHEHIQKELSYHETSLDGFYVCPHHPTAGKGDYLADCDCRKGRPGMLLKAAKEFNIKLVDSYIVGDKQSDIDAGMVVGCRTILVLTGYGAQTAENLDRDELPVVEDLGKAVELILKN